MRLYFTIPGQPVAKARTRHAILKQCRKCDKKTMAKQCRCGSQDLSMLTTVPMSDKDTVIYENQVAACARDAMTRAGVTELLSGPLYLRATFYFLIPASRTKKLQPGDWHMQRPDLDNCVKSILDGLNKVLFLDDSQLVKIEAKKMWAQLPEADIIVETQDVSK